MRLRLGSRRLGRPPGSARGVGAGARLGLSAALVRTASLGPAAPCRAAGLVIEAPRQIAAPGCGGVCDLPQVNTIPIGDACSTLAAEALGQ
jgi:hypothetical protein